MGGTCQDVDVDGRCSGSLGSTPGIGGEIVTFLTFLDTEKAFFGPTGQMVVGIE